MRRKNTKPIALLSAIAILLSSLFIPQFLFSAFAATSNAVQTTIDPATNMPYDYSNIDWNMIGDTFGGIDDFVYENTGSSTSNAKVQFTTFKPIEKSKYYLVKFGIQFTSPNAVGVSKLSFNFDSSNKVNSFLDFNYATTNKSTVTFIVFQDVKKFTATPYVLIPVTKNNKVTVSDITIYKMSEEYATACLNEGKLASTTPVPAVATATNPVDTADFDSIDNTFAGGSFEDANGTVTLSKFGDKSLNVNENKSFEFAVDKNRYYIVSYWAKTGANQGNPLVEIALKYKDNPVIASKNLPTDSEWNKYSFIIRTNDIQNFILTFKRGNIAENADLFIDGVSVVKLPENETNACKIIDTFTIETYNATSLATAQSIFGANVENAYKEIYSPEYYHNNGKNKSYAELLSDIVKKTEVNVVQTSYDESKEDKNNGISPLYDYSGYIWDLYGENLVTDPTVNNFVSGEGLTRKYGTYVKSYDSNYIPTEFNNEFWWDKYSDRYHGFTMYTQDMEDGVLDKKDKNNKSISYDKAFISPYARGEVSPDPKKSLTNDGSGVIYSDKSGRNWYALPAMKSFSYYLVKFDISFSKKNQSSDFDFNKSAGTENIVKKGFINLTNFGSGVTNQVTFIVYTGTKNYSAPSFNFYLTSGNAVYIDNFDVYKLDSSYGERSIEEGRLLPMTVVDKTPSATTTDNISGYDFDSSENLIPSGSFETDDDFAYADAKFGNKVANVSDDYGKDIVFETDINKYYLLSFWSKNTSSSGCGTAKLISGTDIDSKVLATDICGTTTTWTQKSFVFYSAYNSKYTLSFLKDTISPSDKLLIDGVSLIKLPADVSDSCYAVDTYRENTYDPERMETAANTFGLSGVFASLNSPYYFSQNGANRKYIDLYKEYDDMSSDMKYVNRGFAPDAQGSRDNVSSLKYDCKPEDNLVSDSGFSDEAFWITNADAGKEYVTLSSEEAVSGTSLKFSLKGKNDGTEKVYKKKITGFNKKTNYCLTIYGKGYANPLSDFDIGFMDTKYSMEIENPMIDYGSDAKNVTFKQRTNIKCQDGNWYKTVYMFNTGKNTEFYFFIRATVGEIYLDDIKIFETSKAIYTTEKTPDMIDTSIDVEKFACDDKDNLIKNGRFDNEGEFWNQFNGMDKFVEVAVSEDNKMLHFKGNNLAYYYLPWVEVEPNIDYTFSYWAKNLNGQKSSSVLVSENNTHGSISPAYSVSENYGEWKLFSVKFKCSEPNRVALGIYDRDGEAVFDNIRLFESSKGYALERSKDMPIGGNTFSYTKLGTDGVTIIDNNSDNSDNSELQDEDEDEYYEYYEEYYEDYDDETTKNDTNTVGGRKKIRKKIITTVFPVWAIVLICCGIALAVGGTTFFIIFLRKRKKKNTK